MSDINDQPDFLLSDSSNRDDPNTGVGKALSTTDQEFLKQIRKDYTYCLDYWRPIREEAATDVQYASGNPWTQSDIQEREGRPCLTPDELSQYIKQATNNLRQNKRAIQVNPKGEGATDEDARRRQAIIRGIEYASNAQAAYTTAFEGAVTASMGFWRITTERVGNDFAVQPRIKRIPNLFSVLCDPNAKEADFSDMELCFVTDVMRKDDFARKYPKAQKTSFSTDDCNMAPEWLAGENIVIAEYWVVEKQTRKKMQVKGPAGITTVYQDELAKDAKPEVLNEADEVKRTVRQYITNGVEILEDNAWPGSWIPIIGVFGEELYTNEGGQSKRMFYSLIRRARSSQKMLAYIASQEQEEFGMAPRTPLFIWEGQELADEKALRDMNKVPYAFIKLKIVRDEATGQALSPPLRQPFIPNTEAYELARESWRRAIQASIGIAPLPTQAQKQNEKSGIALEHIQTQEAIGSLHFTGNLDRALENCGRQLNELITKVMDTPRQMSARDKSDQHSLMMVTSQQYEDHGKQQFQIGEGDDYLVSDRGEFDVTISAGPSYQSQRDQMSDFVDTLIKEIAGLGFPQPIVASLLAKAIKMKDLGPAGDEVIKILEPPNPQDLPPQAQQIVTQLQGQIQQQGQELAQLHMERAAKTMELQNKTDIAKLQEVTKLAVAMITASKDSDKLAAQQELQKLGFAQDSFASAHDAAHEQAMSQVEHQQQGQQAAQQMALQAQQQVAQPGANG